jgi:hypothetical protein
MTMRDMTYLGLCDSLVEFNSSLDETLYRGRNQFMVYLNSHVWHPAVYIHTSVCYIIVCNQDILQQKPGNVTITKYNSIQQNPSH